MNRYTQLFFLNRGSFNLCMYELRLFLRLSTYMLCRHISDSHIYKVKGKAHKNFIAELLFRVRPTHAKSSAIQHFECSDVT